MDALPTQTSRHQTGGAPLEEMRFRELPFAKLKDRSYSHQRLLADQTRCESFRAAIHEAVKPGDVVVDLGTGSGLLAFFAVQAGARKVYAIELGPIVRYAERIAKQNKLDDKIEFIRGVSYDIQIPELADVVIGENLGSLGIDENILPMYQDAARRFLKPGGKMIPNKVAMSVALVSDTGVHSRYIDPWRSKMYGINFDTFLHIQLQTLFLGHFDDERIITLPQLYSESVLDQNLSYSETTDKTLQFDIDRPTTLSGFIAYFDASLTNSIRITNAPSSGKGNWDQVYFPVGEVLQLKHGYKVSVRIKFYTTRSDVIVSWRVIVAQENGETVYDYRSTRYPPLSTPADLIGPIIPPEIEPENRWIAFVLSRFDGSISREQLNDMLHAIDPKLSGNFIERTLDLAFTYVGTKSISPELAVPERINFLIKSHFDGLLCCDEIAEILWTEFPETFSPSHALVRIQQNIEQCVASAISV